jgi:hypothetical protein
MILAVVCIVVLAGVAVAVAASTRHSATPSSATSPANSLNPPTISQTWFAALGFEVCGDRLPNLPPGPNTQETGLTTDGTGVVTVAPKSLSESGARATLGTFASHYPGLELTSTSLRYPGRSVYSNGATCPRGTPDAGEQGVVQVVSWSTFAVHSGTRLAGSPGGLRFTDGQIITVAFAPNSAKIRRPAAASVTALINHVDGQYVDGQ